MVEHDAFGICGNMELKWVDDQPGLIAVMDTVV